MTFGKDCNNLSKKIKEINEDDNILEIDKIKNKILNVNCDIALNNMRHDIIDLIVTSPPYNISHKTKSGIKYSKYEDDKSRRTYELTQINNLNSIYDILKPTGSLFYNHRDISIDGLTISPLEYIFKSKMKLKDIIIWNRSAITHPAPKNKIKRFYSEKEYIFWLVKDVKQYYFNGLYAKYKTIWNFLPDSHTIHPAPFPLELPTRCILACSKENDLVLDPYCGSGTTLVACKKLNRNYIGFEIDKEYVTMANNRLNKTGDTRLDIFA